MVINLELITSITIFLGSFIVYVIVNLPKVRKMKKLGLLFSAYVRDIDALLTSKLLSDWSELSIPNRLDRLKSLYDLIESFDILNMTDSILGEVNDEDVKKLTLLLDDNNINSRIKSISDFNKGERNNDR